MLSIRPILFSILFIFTVLAAGQQYKNFRVAVYSRAYETREMGKREYIEPIRNELSAQLKVGKIYLETHRDLIIVDQPTLDAAKQFFKSRGVAGAGGITYTVSEPNRFETFCYANPEHRKKVRGIAEHTARNFDEFILDDFFFTNCKCDLCIKAKGTKNWTEYQLELMTEAAQTLVIGPSKAVNPKVKIVIKYPNRIREELCAQLPVQLEGPVNVSIYLYDNNTFIVESFLNETTQVNLVLDKPFTTLNDILSGAAISGELRKPSPGWWNRDRKEKNVFSVSIKPHSFRVFRY